MKAKDYPKPIFVYDTDMRDNDRNILAMFKCACGNDFLARKTRVNKGRVNSCGCSRHKDLTGKKFGRLITREQTNKRIGGSVVWICECDCGNIVEESARALESYLEPSCGCFIPNDLSGQQFDRLLVVERLGGRGDNRGIWWLCECECGNIIELTTGVLNDGQHSCGCYQRDVAKSRRGENSPHWNSTLTESEREFGRKILGYSEWRQSVFERDNYTCQICGDNTGGNLVAHHLDGYNWCTERRLDIENGVTLCNNKLNPSSKCHGKFHMEYGFGNNTEEQFAEFYQQTTGKIWRI